MVGSAVTSQRPTQLSLPWRVRLVTTRQTRTPDGHGDFVRRRETVTGVVLHSLGTMASVRFDGAWTLGSVRGCTLLCDVTELDHVG